MARPSKYKPEFVAQAEKLCKLGATDMEIADFFEVNVATLNRWKAEYPEFCASIKSGKSEADERVERSLFARANGFEHDDTDIRVVDGTVVQTPIRKHYPPDTTAAIFWLKNRRPGDWRDKQEHELSGKDGGPIETKATLDVTGLSTAALAEIVAATDAAQRN
jgi:hypothetical protein